VPKICCICKRERETEVEEVKATSLRLKSEAGSIKLELFKFFLALIVAIVGAVFTYQLGKSKGEEGKKPGFDQIYTDLKLNGTKWQVSYEDFDPEASDSSNAGSDKKKPIPKSLPTPPQKVANVEFRQFGSRIVGEGYDSDGRKWIIEGAAANRRLCYIYYDTGGQRLSFGTVLVELDNFGTQMRGQWMGWAPESNNPRPYPVTLRKLTE
jgi:hypothetical protein